MSPELEEYLLKQGAEIIAAQYVAKIAMRYATNHDPAILDGQIRMERLRLQEKRAAGESTLVAERVVALFEEVATMEVVGHPGIRPS